MVEQAQIGAIQIAAHLARRDRPGGAGRQRVQHALRVPRHAHMRKVIDGADRRRSCSTRSPPARARLVALGWMDGGSRSLYTKKPVRKPADLKGMKIRMMGNPLFVDTMNAMGGNGISMGYGEVFSALQTGVIDGAENNPPSFFTVNHYTTRHQVLRADQPPDHSRDLRDVQGDLGQAVAGRPGAGEEALARSADGAARAVGQERGRVHRQAQGRRRRVHRRSTTSCSTTRPRRCAPSTAPSSRDLMKRIDATK